jgi:hypothetical protein
MLCVQRKLGRSKRCGRSGKRNLGHTGDGCYPLCTEWTETLWPETNRPREEQARIRDHVLQTLKNKQTFGQSVTM